MEDYNYKWEKIVQASISLEKQIANKDCVEKIKKHPSFSHQLSKDFHLTPELRWKFLAGCFFLLGALAVSASYFMMGQMEWDLHRTMHQNQIVYGITLLSVHQSIFR